MHKNMKLNSQWIMFVSIVCLCWYLQGQDISAPRTELDAARQAIQSGDYRTALFHTQAVVAAVNAELLRAPASEEVVPPLIHPSPGGDTSYLLVMLDQTQQALAGGDLLRVRNYSVALGTALLKEWDRTRPSPNQQLRTIEDKAVGVDAFRRFLLLPQLTKSAYAAGDMDKASQYADEALATAQAHANAWPQGEAIHHANLIAGRIAFQRGDVATAKSRLLAAGRSVGSPSLSTFGPNMALAKDLLNAGERDVVIQYLTECKNFWKMDNGAIAKWTAIIKQGQIPDFGANLLY
jgi:hypothetical protein